MKLLATFLEIMRRKRVFVSKVHLRCLFCVIIKEYKFANIDPQFYNSPCQQKTDKLIIAYLLESGVNSIKS